MGNAAAGGLEQESAEHSVGGTTAMSDPVPTLQKKQSAPVLPMPPEEELEKRFDAVLVSGFGVLKKDRGSRHTLPTYEIRRRASIVLLQSQL